MIYSPVNRPSKCGGNRAVVLSCCLVIVCILSFRDLNWGGSWGFWNTEKNVGISQYKTELELFIYLFIKFFVL